ncbi:hypothetical protein A9Q81_18045 [Gammaproteobacteria bacterium 42_54_T18]|nr:hypothetical protein A9Q81_18045 [Gammaproteobacteria bacterium 42_54_T18]
MKAILSSGIKRLTVLALGFYIAISSISSLSAQTLTVAANQWQLISFTHLPDQRTVEDVFGESATNGTLESLWGFDNTIKQWRSWPVRDGVASSNLSQLEPGLGYWVKTSEEVIVDLADATNSVGEMVLNPGWNLVGLPITGDMPHDQVLASVPYLELWSYEPAQNAFLAVRRAAGSRIILEEQFSTLSPGKAYWIYLSEQATLLPSLGTLLPPDIDIEPLLTFPEYGQETLWGTLSPGDVDWDEDGFFDFPNTQKSIAFGDFLNRQRISIVNEGNSVLSWQATIEPAVDWLLFEAFNEDGEPVLTNIAIGSATDTNGELILVANRVGLPPNGIYTTQVVLRANGAVQEKRIDVALEVADVVGDYEVTVRLDNIDGKDADLHNPKYFLSFARDGQGVKAFLDEERSLLIPETTYLSGSMVADPQSHVKVLGQLFLPVGHAHNPYNRDIRREFTLIGHRSDGQDGLPPLDLRGDYAENIYGLFDQPIQLKGEFVARRLSPLPKKQDLTVSDAISGEIVAVDTDSGISTFEFTVTDRLSITDIKTNLKIDHLSPETLSISLVGPSNTQIILHQNQQRSLADVRFDDFDASVESLDNFDGQLAFGLWRLVIQNTSANVGTLEKWTMDIAGATVYEIQGQTEPGTQLQLTGCGVVRSTTADASGNFSFDGLIPCDYDISVVQHGYEVTTTNVRITSCVKTFEEKCDTQSDYIVSMTAEQLAEMQPQLQNANGQMEVVVSPLSLTILPTQDVPLEVKAVDITQYADLDTTLQSRTWELYKRINSWSSITSQGYLVDVPASGQQSPLTNLISYSENSNEWTPSASVTIERASITDPRGGNNAVKATHNGDGSAGIVFDSVNIGEGSFPILKDQLVTFSVFVKPGSLNEVSLRFSSGDAVLTRETINITTGAHLSGDSLMPRVTSLANGWYRVSVTAKAPQDFGSLNCELQLSKNGSVSINSQEHLYVFGPQAELYEESQSLWVPIGVGDITIFIPNPRNSGYLTTGANHAIAEAPQQQDVLVTAQSTSVGTWTHNFDNNPAQAGVYYIVLNSDVKNSAQQDVILSYTTADITLFDAQLDAVHFGIHSVHAGAGSSGLTAMDMATFDINRPPLADTEGEEDSDSFGNEVDEATLTNKHNEVFEGPNGGFIKNGMDEPVGDLNRHYRMYISTGQLFFGGSVYGNSGASEEENSGENLRLDVGIQSAEEGE